MPAPAELLKSDVDMTQGLVHLMLDDRTIIFHPPLTNGEEMALYARDRGQSDPERIGKGDSMFDRVRFPADAFTDPERQETIHDFMAKVLEDMPNRTSTDF